MAQPTGIQNVPAADVIFVATAAELADAVGSRPADHGALVDYGRYHAGLGHAPPADHDRIDFTGATLEHYVADMTVRIGAGLTIGQLNEAIRPKGQWLALDGLPGDMTLGEAVAHQVYGPLRVGFGSLRDQLLGLSYVDAAGQVITVGGRTVKNVAGYDVTRLMVGNMNTLGLLTELCLRTCAIPEQVTRVAIRPFPVGGLDRTGTALLTGDAMPIYIDLQAPPGQPPSLYLGYAGSPGSCAAQVEAMQQWIGVSGFGEAELTIDHHDLAADAANRAARRAWRWREADAANATFGLVKLIVPPGRFGSVIKGLDATQLGDWTVDAIPTLGVAWLGGACSAQRGLELDALLTRAVGAVGGHRVWLQRPEHTTDLAPFAPLPHDWPMLQRIKQALDPGQRLNPGRLFTLNADPASHAVSGHTP